MKQISSTNEGYYVDITCPQHSFTFLQYNSQIHALSCTCGFYIPLPASYRREIKTSILRSEAVVWYAYLDAAYRAKTVMTNSNINARRARKRLGKVLQRKEKVIGVYVIQMRRVEVEGIDWCGGGCKPTDSKPFLVRLDDIIAY